MRHFLTLLILVSLSASAFGQKRDSVQRLNSIKYDLTSNLLYSEAFIVSYERVLKKNQSAVITFGPQKFPTISSFGDNVKVQDDRKRKGFKVGGEYRFYLLKENRHLAPRGIYLGPYTSYHNFDNERTLSVKNADGTTTDATFTSKINIFNIGMQMGYQFIIGNRWCIDLLFLGPSISRYGATLDLDGDFSNVELDDAQQEIVDKLLGRWPFLKDVLDEDEVTVKGKSSAWSAGWRYQFQVGYHFGRKKK